MDKKQKEFQRLKEKITKKDKKTIVSFCVLHSIKEALEEDPEHNNTYFKYTAMLNLVEPVLDYVLSIFILFGCKDAEVSDEEILWGVKIITLLLLMGYKKSEEKLDESDLYRNYVLQHLEINRSSLNRSHEYSSSKLIRNTELLELLLKRNMECICKKDQYKDGSYVFTIDELKVKKTYKQSSAMRKGTCNNSLALSSVIKQLFLNDYGNQIDEWIAFFLDGFRMEPLNIGAFDVLSAIKLVNIRCELERGLKSSSLEGSLKAILKQMERINKIEKEIDKIVTEMNMDISIDSKMYAEVDAVFDESIR